MSLMVTEGASAGGQEWSLIKTATLLFTEKLVVAASSQPSPLKSPVATAVRFVPAGDLTGGEKAPLPLPRRTLTALTVPLSVRAAISRWPSWLKSASETLPVELPSP